MNQFSEKKIGKPMLISAILIELRKVTQNNHKFLRIHFRLFSNKSINFPIQKSMIHVSHNSTTSISSLNNFIFYLNMRAIPIVYIYTGLHIKCENMKCFLTLKKCFRMAKSWYCG